jgi:DNA-binding IclR family transcriptional regulator
MKWRLSRLRLRHRRTVLDALAQVGEAGMTPNSLEVTTELNEQTLNAALVDLMDAGLVKQRVDNSMLTDLRALHYLLNEPSEPGR